MTVINEKRLMICAMHKACKYGKECMHSMTHFHHHSVCYNRTSDSMRLCSGFRLDYEFFKQMKTTYLSTERQDIRVDPKILRMGWCCSWEYWKEHGGANLDCLIGDLRQGVLYHRDPEIYDTYITDNLFVPINLMSNGKYIYTRDRDRGREVRR